MPNGSLHARKPHQPPDTRANEKGGPQFLPCAIDAVEDEADERGCGDREDSERVDKLEGDGGDVDEEEELEAAKLVSRGENREVEQAHCRLRMRGIGAVKIVTLGPSLRESRREGRTVSNSLERCELVRVLLQPSQAASPRRSVDNS